MAKVSAWKLLVGAGTAAAALTAFAAPPPPAEPKFVFATFTNAVEGEPPRAGPAEAAVWTVGGDGFRGPPRPLDVLPVMTVALRETARDGGAVPATCGVVSVGPAGGYLAQAFDSEVVEESSPYWPALVNFADGTISWGWQSRGIQGQRHRLYLVAPGGRVTRVGDWTLEQASAVWSADGSSVYVTRLLRLPGLVRANPPAFLPELTRVTTRIDVATGATRRLALPPGTRPLAAGPDGKSLLVAINKASPLKLPEDQLSLVTLPADPDGPLTLRPIGKPAGAAGYRDRAAFSPDGRRAVVATTEYVPYPEASKQPGVTYLSDQCHVRRFQLVDLAAGMLTPLLVRPVAVPDFGGEVHWSPDGKRVAFTDAEGWELGPDGLQGVKPHVVTCDPDGKNTRRVSIPTPRQAFNPTVLVGGPQFVGWR